MSAAAMVVAIATEGAFGWPDRLFRAIGHPVTWMGKLISNLDRRFNLPEDAPEERRFWGRISLLILLASTLVPTIFATILLPDGLLGMFLTGLLAAPLVAPRSMYTHVADVAKPLKNRDIPAARTAVAKIVGRNPNELDEPATAHQALHFTSSRDFSLFIKSLIAPKKRQGTIASLSTTRTTHSCTTSLCASLLGNNKRWHRSIVRVL